jgi:hypothetical protein
MESGSVSRSVELIEVGRIIGFDPAQVVRRLKKR